MNYEKIALGGGCHWCTEAVFQSLKGVIKVEQGFVVSKSEDESFSEAILIYFNPKKIALKILIEIHLYTHKSTSNHSMRRKYRSAVYFFNEKQKFETIKIIDKLQNQFDNELITKSLEFKSFKSSREQFLNYYYNNPEKPFCETFIEPKLKKILKQFSQYVNTEKLNHLYHEEY